MWRKSFRSGRLQAVKVAEGRRGGRKKQLSMALSWLRRSTRRSAATCCCQYAEKRPRSHIHRRLGATPTPILAHIRKQVPDFPAHPGLGWPATADIDIGRMLRTRVRADALAFQPSMGSGGSRGLSDKEVEAGWTFLTKRAQIPSPPRTLADRGANTRSRPR